MTPSKPNAVNAASRSPGPAADLRSLPADKLALLGEESLREHVLAQAMVAHYKHGPFLSALDGAANNDPGAARLDPRSQAEHILQPLLQDPECVRYPLRLIFEFGEMAMHQFAQPDLDWRNQEENGRVLYLRPSLTARPDLIILAVAYMLPVINYGEVINDTHCVSYGATLLGMLEEEFYARVCELADFAGAERRIAGTAVPSCF